MKPYTDRDMLKLRMTGEGKLLYRRIVAKWPAAGVAVERSRHVRAQLKPYQAAALFALARQYNETTSRILEIGTGDGYSASIIAQACPLASEIVTLEPAEAEYRTAEKNLDRFSNVWIVRQKSWDYWSTDDRTGWSTVFVDGDHKRVARDMPWWNRCGPGSLMLWHDYTELGSPHVVDCVDRLGELLMRGPAVLLMDDEGVGMAGYYVRLGDRKWEA